MYLNTRRKRVGNCDDDIDEYLNKERRKRNNEQNDEDNFVLATVEAYTNLQIRKNERVPTSTKCIARTGEGLVDKWI